MRETDDDMWEVLFIEGDSRIPFDDEEGLLILSCVYLTIINKQSRSGVPAMIWNDYKLSFDHG